MYGKTLGVANTATGISLLPDTGDNHLLFALASSLLVSGIAIFIASFVIGRKARQTEAN
jgi:LPXTG-motif cell wall-anchored protein